MATRSISIILAFVMLLSVVSCTSSSDSDAPGTTVPVADTPVNAPDISELYRERDDKLPELDLGGQTIHFLTMKSNGITGEAYNDEIWVDELKSEPLNDSIYNRNVYVMERLNCKITNEIYEAHELFPMFQKAYGADEDIYQVIGFEAAPALVHSFDGYFYNLKDLDAQYIEFDAPWWSSQFFDEVATDEQVYTLAGSLSLSMIRSIHATYFNKNIAEDEGIEDLYAVVKEGRWTIDYQTELCSGMYKDLNGDSERDIDDRYGYATSFYWAVDSYWSAFDISILSRYEDGYEFDLNEEKAYDGMLKIYDLAYGDSAYGKWLEDFEVEEMFANDGAFMITQKLSCVETPLFRNMQSDYGIIPMPKFDQAQKEYYSMPFEIFQTYMIPKTARDPDSISAVLEALSAETWRKVIPTYSEVALKGKYLTDPKSREMFDMITNNTKIDAGLMYYSMINAIGASLYRYPIERNEPENFSSNLEKIKRRMGIYVKALNAKVFGE